MKKLSIIFTISLISLFLLPVTSFAGTKQFQVDTGGTLTTNLAAYYKLEDVTEYYIGGGTYDLTNNNTVAFNSGKVNNAGNTGASSTNKSLTVGSNLGNTGGAFSMSLWVKINTTPSANVILAVQANTTSDSGYSLYYDGTVLGANRFRNGISDNVVTETITFDTSIWYHLVLTYDGTTLRLYRDDSSKGTPLETSGDGASDPFNAFGIFGFPAPWSTWYSSALVDEVGLWNKALTTTEITDLYNGGNGQTMVEVEIGRKLRGSGTTRP